MKNLITAAIIAMAATSAQARLESDFAECVARRIAVENGTTLEAARAARPAGVREAEITLAIMAFGYLGLPESLKPQGLVVMLTEFPESAACLRILEN